EACSQFPLFDLGGDRKLMLITLKFNSWRKFNSLRTLGVLCVSCGYADLTETPTKLGIVPLIKLRDSVCRPSNEPRKITARDAEDAEVARRVESQHPEFLPKPIG